MVSARPPRKPAATCVAKSTSTRASKKIGSRTKPKFVWKRKEWEETRELCHNVHLLRSTVTAQARVVKKVVSLEEGEPADLRHIEVRLVELLPRCNRIVQVLSYVPHYPDPGNGTIFYDYFPLGDLRAWREKEYVRRNHKQVPESNIWRFFIQVGQALAFIQNELGPSRENRACILHRDIKPKNILVMDNGSTYPSFKLHDFGCGTLLHSLKKSTSYCGTYEWQPPENPKINTRAADMWAVGACVYFMAVGGPPLKATKYPTQAELQERGITQSVFQRYGGFERCWAARGPREVVPINLSRDEQIARAILPLVYSDRGPIYMTPYSDLLNKWMCRALAERPSERPTAMTLVNEMTPQALEILKKMAGTSGLVDLELKWEERR
ncbi:serine/threonine protein kinase-like protein [Sporormia fimetaria CBS 119925]|uniref:non-specific serine/threonine protein kinase n=1 Tax=Sporormia fimetaria CBS 119925 TaxID=1340428 RepID=A0A6A6VRX8_9PLEO|nr:serine/threonine protein kinase-like protein [Sporormia fimetaria CBS 119925]